VWCVVVWGGGVSAARGFGLVVLGAVCFSGCWRFARRVNLRLSSIAVRVYVGYCAWVGALRVRSCWFWLVVCVGIPRGWDVRGGDVLSCGLFGLRVFVCFVTFRCSFWLFLLWVRVFGRDFVCSGGLFVGRFGFGVGLEVGFCVAGR